MSGNTLTVDELNARRKQAVLLRLQGQKLASVTETTGLSAPTVIAATKAYRTGGWEAVRVQPRRGRPRADQPVVTGDMQAALVEQMLAAPAPDGGLWSRQAVATWLESRGASSSAGTVARLCEALGLEQSSVSSVGRGRANAAPRLPTLPPATSEAGTYRMHGLEAYPDAIQRHCPGTRIGMLCTRTARQQLCWMLFRAPLKESDYLRFLDQVARLVPRQKVELSIPGAARLLRSDSIARWLADHGTRLILADPQIGSPSTVRPEPKAAPPQAPVERKPMTLTHLQRLEAESIHIMREVVAETDKPVMLYSIGKDSAVMLHLAMKAFYPSKPPFPLLHVDTRWKFRDMYAFREKMARELGLELLVHINPDGVAKNINPFTHGSAIHTDIMKTEGLKQALDKYGFDAAFGGARRDEEKSRAKERIFSFRSDAHRWDPKNQRPELWKLYNARKHKGESMRVFPISNWTELDIWQYIYLNNIPIVPLYYSAERPVVERDGTLIMVDDDRMPLRPGEVPMMRKVRFRTLGCYPLTGAVESEAATLPEIIQEMLLTKTSERQGRVIDHDSAASMEKKKQEGYF